MNVLTTTIEGLLLGHPLDREGWLDLASQLRNGRSAEEDVILALARIATVEDTDSCDAILKTIPAANKLACVIGEALTASRCVDMADSESLMRLVLAIYQVLPYREERTPVQPALERLAKLQIHAIEIGKGSLDLSAASMFTLLANTLSMSFGNHSYLETAIALTDRLPLLRTQETREEKRGCYVVMSNLITTWKQLANHRPLESEYYLLRGVELASRLYESYRDMTQLRWNLEFALHLVVQALRNLIFMLVELVRVSPTHSAQHIAAAWRYVSHLQELADEQDDPDLRREAKKAEDFLLNQVGPLPGSPRRAEPSLGSAEEVCERINMMSRTSWTAAQQVKQLPTAAEQHRAVVEHIGGLYYELAQSLQAAIQEVGINRHVSRVLLALGAIASGRLWPLARSAVEACVLSMLNIEEGASHRHWIKWAQEQPSRRLLDLESNYAACVCALATFSDTLSSDNDLAVVLKTVLQERNREILKHVLPAGQHVHLPGRQLSKSEDVNEIMTLMQSFGGNGHRRDPAITSAHVSEHDRECSCGSGKPFSQCHGTDAGLAEAVPTRAEVTKPTDEAPLSAVWDLGPDGSARNPEDMIGCILRMDGEPYRFDSIVGMGTQKVVFGLTHVQSGHRKAFAMFLSSFSPNVRLAEYLECIISGQQSYDPDKIIALCNEVLASQPNNSISAFNKGTALLAKKDFVSAIKAFNLALINEPNDLYNLVYKAEALAEIAQHSAAVVHLARASRLYPTKLREFLNEYSFIKEKLSASVMVVLHDDPNRTDARQLLEGSFF